MPRITIRDPQFRKVESPLLSFGFRFYFQLDVGSHVFEQANRYGILAQHLDVILQMDLSSLDFESLLFKRLSDIRISDRAIKRILFADFAADHDLDRIQHRL